ncbi:MAG: DEAD/DEAH box helicase, partial [Acidobacteriota bacterium]
MIVLHAACRDERLLLWGEIPDGGQRGPSRRISRAENRYPYDAGESRLRQALREAAVGFKLGKRKFQTQTAWLPARGRLPVPSSPLIAEPPVSRRKARLAPWAVTTYPLSADEAVGLLCRCMGQQTLAPGVVVGLDLAYWAKALRFAGSLVARQKYLPGLSAEEDGWRARWEPVFAGTDAEELARLAEQMPSVARALSSSPTLAPPATSSTAALEEAVTEWVDELVRSSTPEGDRPRRGRPRKRRPFDSVHDAWLAALRSRDGRIEGDGRGLAELAVQIGEWRRPVAVSAASPFRLCFRLEEPEDGGAVKRAGDTAERWYVRYLLQPHNDPSLLVSIEDVWKAREAQAAILKRHGASLKGFLLSSLGQAAGISPHIEASLETAAPAGYVLDTSGAHQFLTETALALEQTGYGVLLPAWWSRKGTKLRPAVRAIVKSPKMKGGVLSMDTVVRFDWEVALGGQKLTLRELEALARLKAPLVRVRGQWVEMNGAEIQAAIDFWRKGASGQTAVRDVLKMALGAKETPGGLELDGVQATGWIGRLLERLDGRGTLEDLPAPRGFSGTLRHYQVRGFSWLAFLRQWGLGACLADDMGLGKTIQALALIQRDWKKDRKRPVLLVCPMSVVNNWQKEASRFTPGLPVLVHHGVGRKKGARFKKEAKKHAMVISSYALLQRDLEFLKDVAWAGVILDEAQNIKNPETKQARAARALPADYRIALTGTPVENNVGDLWSIME